MGTFNIVPLGSIVVSKHALGFLLLCSVFICSVHRDLRLPPCLCERSSVLSVSFGVRKPASTRTSVEALPMVTSKSDQVVNCRWSTGVGRLGPRHDILLLITGRQLCMGMDEGRALVRALCDSSVSHVSLLCRMFQCFDFLVRRGHA